MKSPIRKTLFFIRGIKTVWRWWHRIIDPVVDSRWEVFHHRLRDHRVGDGIGDRASCIGGCDPDVIPDPVVSKAISKECVVNELSCDGFIRTPFKNTRRVSTRGLIAETRMVSC